MSPSPGEPPDRTIPEWMDPQNLHGRLYYVILKAADGHKLPQNPFIIGRSVEKVGKIEGFFEKKQGWYVIKTRSKDQIRELAKLTCLTDGTPIVIARHPSLNKRKCVVTCQEAQSMDEKELLAELSHQKVIEVRRITKKTPAGVVGTPTLILTISSTVIPEFIHFGFLRVRTRLYYPLPLLCRNCLQYGHTKQKCTSPLSCSKCNSNEHDSQNCKNHPYCGNCKTEGHSPINRSCPTWLAETAALKITTEQNIPIAAARKMIQQKNSTPTTFASIVRTADQQQPKTTNNSTPQPPAQIQQKEAIQRQQQTTQQKRTNQITTHLKPASPPRKRITPQPSPTQSSDEAEEVRCEKANGSPSQMEQIKSITPKPPQLPSPSPNPFQPSPNIKTNDPRPVKTFIKK
ncbi:uncharacterized protein LOC129760327 [Uranotaenia lowii]|uniref:uncharacterized protein LOC129743308 n=1 Tax=Uranotaenia lowii TaxID=190385 RepID=UPI00247A0A2D|nr:uncharacterized protein LOC129743308 [Uranotaenia lowii]XP_055613945.1 uncharacterized protein LOC129760327 [Uranotaenia lowii]